MKTVKLLSLVLTNYRNLDYLALDFGGAWSKIVGENRIGKTNTLEAIYWLLTDKLLNGSSDIQAIKCLSDTKKVVRVEATFDIDGKAVTLKKEFCEVWSRVRNTDRLEMKGHTTSYFYNGVEQPTIKAYQTLLNEDFGISGDYGKIDVMRLLIDPTYVGELGESKDWTELRTFIINIIGDVKDDDVFAADDSLSLISSDLALVNGRVDQLKKQYKGEIDNLNDTIIGNDAQIQLLEATERPTDDEVSVARAMVKKADDEIAKLNNSSGKDSNINFINHQIALKEKEISDVKLALTKDNPFTKQFKDKEAQVSALMNGVSNLRTEIWNCKDAIKDKTIARDGAVARIAQLETSRKDLLIQYHDLDDKIKNPEANVSLVCPTCNRPLENTSEIIHSMITQWSGELVAVVDKGKVCATDIANAKNEVAQYDSDLVGLNTKLSGLESDLAEGQKKLDVAQYEKNDLYDKMTTYQPAGEELEVLNRQLDTLKADLVKAQDESVSANALTRESISRIDSDAEPFRNVIKKYDYWVFQNNTLETVRETRATNGKKLAVVEQKRELLNKFVLVKLKMLDERVAKVFGNVKFQLVKDNINGGYDPVCKPFIYDVDKDSSTNVLWRSGSKSERIVTGVAIAERIKAALDLPNLPFLFDEGGEISTSTFDTKFKTNSQLICVKVQDNIKKPAVLKI